MANKKLIDVTVAKKPKTADQKQIDRDARTTERGFQALRDLWWEQDGELVPADPGPSIFDV